VAGGLSKVVDGLLQSRSQWLHAMLTGWMQAVGPAGE